MNSKSTWVLLVLAAMLLAFIFFVEQPLRRQREIQTNRLLLPGLNPSLITNIEIKPWGQHWIQAARQSNAGLSWSLVRPVAYPAQNQSISELLKLLAKLEWLDRVSVKELADRPNAQEEFGFTQPRFIILLQGSGSDHHLEIGHLGVFNDMVSLQVVGNNAIFQTDADILRWLPTDDKQWRDRSLLNVTNLAFQTLRVRASGKELFDLYRDATNHLWFMRSPLQARADSAKINDLLGRLHAVSILDFETDDPQADLDSYGLQSSDTTPELALTFLDGTHTVAGLQVGRSRTNNPDVVFARRDNPGGIIDIAKDALKAWQAPYPSFLDQHFISLSPSLVQSIAVRGEDDFVVRKQTNGQWLVTDDKTFPADAILMEEWLACLTNVPTEIAKTVVTDFSAYGLSHPALQYTVRCGPEAGAQAEAHLDFGTNKAGKVFERRLREDFVNTISADGFDRLPRASWQLRDRQIWNFATSNVVSATIHQRGGALKFLRDPDGNWTYAPGFNSQVPINSPAVEECALRMGRLRAIYWDGVGREHLERFGFNETSHEVEFEVKRGATNETLRLQFGARSPYYHPYALVVLDGEPLVFEFPADLYQNLVEPNLSLYSARRHLH